jgi:nitrogen fixation-related uncharacterized protein
MKIYEYGREYCMGEWDFLWGLQSDEFEDALASGANTCEWNETAIRRRRQEWDALRAARDEGRLSAKEYEARKAEFLAEDSW